MIEYKEIEFDSESGRNSDAIASFFVNAEIILGDFGFAWHTSSIDCFIDSHRGVYIKFTDGSHTHISNIKSKLVLV